MASFRQQRMRSTVVHEPAAASSSPWTGSSPSRDSSSFTWTPNENEGRGCLVVVVVEVEVGLRGESERVLRFDWRRSESSWSRLRLELVVLLASLYGTRFPGCKRAPSGGPCAPRRRSVNGEGVARPCGVSIARGGIAAPLCVAAGVLPALSRLRGARRVSSKGRPRLRQLPRGSVISSPRTLGARCFFVFRGDYIYLSFAQPLMAAVCVWLSNSRSTRCPPASLFAWDSLSSVNIGVELFMGSLWFWM
jgi:hypothetical protein